MKAMRKNIIALIALVLTCFTASSQTNNIRAVILKQANEMGNFFITKDYASFAKYSHPTMVEMMGGEEKMLEYIKVNFKQLEDEGIVFQKIHFGEPSTIYKVKLEDREELQCTLPQMIEMKIPGGIFTANATLIALSRDKGANWYFIDTSGNNLTSMKKLIPSLSPDLVIPENQEPSFVEDPAPAVKP